MHHILLIVLALAAITIQCSVVARPKVADQYPFVNDNESVEFLKKENVAFIVRAPKNSEKAAELSKQIQTQYGEDTTIVSTIQSLTNAFRSSKTPVIYQDTNPVLRDMKSLSHGTRDNNYLMLMAQPNADTVNVKDFQLAVPFFYCWYVLPQDSNLLIDMSRDLLTDFAVAFQQADFPLKTFKFKADTILHCTAKYLGNNIKLNAENPYFRNPVVAANTGKVFDMKVTGFTFTSGTIGAVVSFDHPAVKTLWNNDLEDWRMNEILKDPAFEDIEDTDALISQLQFADRAHITLALAGKTQAVITGVDLIAIKLKLLAQSNPETQIIDGNEFILLDKSSGFVRLEHPFTLKTVFSGDYFEF